MSTEEYLGFARVYGSSTNNLSGEEKDMWHRRCADCKTSFGADSPYEADEMWWDHVRSEHPTAYAIFLERGIG